MPRIAIGEHILRACGAVSNIEGYYLYKEYELMFKEKQVLNKLLREIKEYKFDDNHFIEQTIWKPRYEQLLKKVSDNA